MPILKHRYEQEAGAESASGSNGAAEGTAAAAAQAAAPGSALPTSGAAAPDPAFAAPTKTWKDDLPEEIRASPSLEKFDTPEALAASYLNLESMEGNSIRIPTADAGEEARQEFLGKLQKNVPELILRPHEDAMDEFYQSLGRPDEPDKYTLPEMPNLPEGSDMSEAEAFRKIAYDAGLTNEQYQSVIGNVTEARLMANAMGQQQFNDENKALREELGNSYDGFYRQAAWIAERTKAPENVIEAFKNGNIDTATLRYFGSLYPMFGKEGAPLSDLNQSPADTGPTPDEAMTKINEIMNNRKHAYWDAHHPEHQKALDYMIELRTQANPGAQTSLQPLKAGF